LILADKPVTSKLFFGFNNLTLDVKTDMLHSVRRKLLMPDTDLSRPTDGTQPTPSLLGSLFSTISGFVRWIFGGHD